MAESKTVIRGDYSMFATLASLPTLVRRQRRLEAKLVPLAPLVEREKVTRKEIDALLQRVGLEQGQGVACLGYDVVHRERAAAEALNQDKAVEQLVNLGVEREAVLGVFAACTEPVGERAKWAEVKPSKGARVRV